MIFIYLKNFAFSHTFTLILIFALNVHSLSELSNSNGLPLRSDVTVYLKSIERIVEFCENHKTDIDLNLEFGLFLLNVNLRHLMIKKKARLPLNLKIKVRRILSTNEALFEFFHSMMKNRTDLKHRIDKNIKTLFNNVNSWVRRIKRYNTVSGSKQNHTNREQLVKKYSSWNVYMDHVSNLYSSRPSPKESDECMSSLSENPIKLRGPSYKCDTSKECNDIIVNGTSYGYALTHRLLYLLAARFGRNCWVYSPQVDDAVIDDLCSTIYEEAQYIAVNGYQHVDLLMEQMCLCSLPGHAAFLQRRWLTSLLRHQTPQGCFRQHLKPSISTVINEATQPWRPSKKGTQLMMDRSCNGHVTAVAAATLGAAVRYVVETHY